jgi:hypothetical protein
VVPHEEVARLEEDSDEARQVVISVGVRLWAVAATRTFVARLPALLVVGLPRMGRLSVNGERQEHRLEVVGREDQGWVMVVVVDMMTGTLKGQGTKMQVCFFCFKQATPLQTPPIKPLVAIHNPPLQICHCQFSALLAPHAYLRCSC